MQKQHPMINAYYGLPLYIVCSTFFMVSPGFTVSTSFTVSPGVPSLGFVYMVTGIIVPIPVPVPILFKFIFVMGFETFGCCTGAVGKAGIVIMVGLVIAGAGAGAGAGRVGFGIFGMAELLDGEIGIFAGTGALVGGSAKAGVTATALTRQNPIAKVNSLILFMLVSS